MKLYNDNLSGFILVLYIFFNIYGALSFIKTGELGGDFIFDNSNVSNLNIVLALALILSSFLVVYLLFSVFCRVKVNVKIRQVRYYYLDRVFLFILVIYTYGVFSGQYSHGGNESKNLIYTIFNYVLVPSQLILVYLFYAARSSSIIYISILASFILLAILKGETYLFIILLPIYAIINNGTLHIFKVFLITFIAFIFYPFIRVFKAFTIDNNHAENKSEMITWMASRFAGESYFDVYVSFFNQSLERFQHVANVAYLIENKGAFLNLLASNDYNIITSSTISLIKEEVFSVSNGRSINVLFDYLHSGHFMGAEHIGIAGYLALWGIYSLPIFVFVIFLMFLSVYLSKMIDESNKVLCLSWIASILFICHSWFNAFTMYIYALFVFLLIVLLLKKKAVNKFNIKIC